MNFMFKNLKLGKNYMLSSIVELKYITLKEEISNCRENGFHFIG